ncbi:hypothetical protein U725_02809 [Lactococcus cremoris subsp. cremoris GE214]|uniref:Uncharacterized protein n=1 Tax=Lactococcus cremoris subsp. cremoris GE214 TaxID=1415168 RepID=A0A084A6X2_LACLC|nr:hypothetical protein U725_02809 [Lactococcus cremoris subsp. cremoris GE214]
MSKCESKETTNFPESFIFISNVLYLVIIFTFPIIFFRTPSILLHDLWFQSSHVQVYLSDSTGKCCHRLVSDELPCILYKLLLFSFTASNSDFNSLETEKLYSYK